MDLHTPFVSNAHVYPSTTMRHAGFLIPYYQPSTRIQRMGYCIGTSGTTAPPQPQPSQACAIQAARNHKGLAPKVGSCQGNENTKVSANYKQARLSCTPPLLYCCCGHRCTHTNNTPAMTQQLWKTRPNSKLAKASRQTSMRAREGVQRQRRMR